LPVIVAGRILIAEPDAPGLLGSAFGRCNVRLEFNGIGAGLGDRLDIGVGCAQTTVMSLRDFADYSATMGPKFDINHLRPLLMRAAAKPLASYRWAGIPERCQLSEKVRERRPSPKQATVTRKPTAP